MDGVWPADRCGALASSAASALTPLRDRHGEASVAALGWASRDILGDEAFAEMRSALREMRREAERVFSFGAHANDETTTRSPSVRGGKCVATAKKRRLFPVGALLTHIAPGASSGAGKRFASERGVSRARRARRLARGYWSPHVDKANVPEYDVSAILYLSNGTPSAAEAEASAATAAPETPAAAEFSGGCLVFLDETDGATRAARVTPRRGRLVVFASGEENVHAVSVVETGARATLNLWLSADASVGADESVFDAELWNEGDEDAP